jgi:CubicO group peptidase (beta-lactamase class C family)
MEGHADPRFEMVADAFRRQLEGTDGGAALAVFHRGEPVVDLWGGNRTDDGDPWEADTLAMCFSTTKGVASAALHLQYEAGLVDYDERVSTYWPEFAQNGKQDVTVRHVLCHESGLHRVRSVIDTAHEMLDWDHMVAKLAAERPAYQPGTRNGYHALTYGWLVGEIVRRVTGRPLAEVIASDLDAPLGLDGLYLGCPPEQRHRVSPLAPMRLPGPSVPEGIHRFRMGVVEGVGRTLALAGSPLNIRRTLNALAPRGMEDVVAGTEIMDASIPAANGFFTARALATMYAVYAGKGTLGDVQMFSPETVRRIGSRQNNRPDLVLVLPMQWRLGYHRIFGATDGFGHFGFGGSGAWADPTRDLAVAMVCNRGTGTPIGDARLIRLSRVVIEAADNAA